MRKFLSKAGLVVYEAKAIDTEALGGAGICDHCNFYSDKGFLIAILNHYVCKECYEEWDKQSTYYPEDKPIEDKRVEFFDEFFNSRDIQLKEAMDELKEKVRQRDRMGGALWWNILNAECCSIANKCAELGANIAEIEEILGKGTFYLNL